MPLVVLTYPGHFLLTVLTIQSYLKYHTTPDRVIIVVDDISDNTWPSYIGDCQELYSKFIPKVEIRPVSLIPSAKQFANGWIRQQIVKLYLDLVVDSTEWFFTDGDIVFLHPVDYNNIPYSVPYYNDTTRQQNKYVKSLLGVDATIQVNGQQVCVSNPAFRTMERTVLQQLRQHVEQLHQKFLVDIHKQYLLNSMDVSEWELIENFKQHVLGKELTLVKYAPHDMTNASADLNFFTHQFLTCYNTDKDLGREWFSNQEITVSDNLWQILSNINR